MNLFLDSLIEGEKFTVIYEVYNDSKSYAQLSKVHKMIRELSGFTGQPFNDIKNMVKENSGLIDVDGAKSFAQCSKEELSLAIQAAIEIGDLVDFNLR